MPNKNWIYYSLLNDPRDAKVKNQLYRFWNEFYTKCNEMNMIGSHELTSRAEYKNLVLGILKDAKADFPLGEDQLLKMQQKIEDLTLLFDDKSIKCSVPNIIKLLIKKNDINGKDYLRNRELPKEDLELLYKFG